MERDRIVRKLQTHPTAIQLFALVSIRARGMRFVLLALLSNGAASWLRPRVGASAVVLIYKVLWTVNYGLYWAFTPG